MSRFDQENMPLGPSRDAALEDALRRALRREEPPLGFEARLLRNLEEQARARSWRDGLAEWWRSLPQQRQVWAAAMCLLLVGGVALERERMRRVEGEAAKERLLLALHVTGSTLRAVHEKVQEATVDSTIVP